MRSKVSSTTLPVRIDVSNFDDAVQKVIENEGGIDSYIDSPSDAGGATRCGISLRFLREIPVERLRKYGIFEEPSAETVQNLTNDQIRLIYNHEYWQAAPFDQLTDQPLCSYIFDACVNHGLSQGIKILQRATWAVSKMYGYVADDGILGTATINHVMRLLSDKYLHDALIAATCAERAGYCRMIAELRPLNREFLHGWLERCYRI